MSYLSDCAWLTCIRHPRCMLVFFFVNIYVICCIHAADEDNEPTKYIETEGFFEMRKDMIPGESFTC